MLVLGLLGLLGLLMGITAHFSRRKGNRVTKHPLRAELCAGLKGAEMLFCPDYSSMRDSASCMGASGERHEVRTFPRGP